MAEAVRAGRIDDPKVGRHVFLMGTIEKSLLAITKKQFSRPPQWIEWWKENRKTFKVPP